jgi:hypothetical protein
LILGGDPRANDPNWPPYFDPIQQPAEIRTFRGRDENCLVAVLISRTYRDLDPSLLRLDFTPLTHVVILSTQVVDGQWSTDGDDSRPRRTRPEPVDIGGFNLGADFPKITPHDLRHTAASLVVSAGNVLTLARMLGHQSPKETLETYADLFDTDLDALAHVLGEARAAALETPTTTVADSGPGEENVPSTQEQVA